MGRYGQISCPVHGLHGLKYRLAGRIAFRGTGNIGNRLGENDLGLWHAHPLHRQRSVHRHCQSLRIRIAHVLGGTDHNPAGDKSDALPRPEQIVHRRIRIRPPHALDKGGNGVIMAVAGLVIPHCPLLYTLLSHIQRDMNPTVLPPAGGEDSKLHGVEDVPGIPAGDIRQKFQSVLLNHRIVNPHAPVTVIDRPFDQLPHCLHRQGFQLKQQRTGQQRPVDLKIWIFCGSSHQNQSAVLHKG